MHQNSAFTTAIKKNEKLSRLKISVDSADSLCTTNPQNQGKVQKTVILPDKRLDYLLTELKLVPNVQNSRKFNQTRFLLER